jgi:hypothetical protein
LNPATIIAGAGADGIVLALPPDARLRYRGPRWAINKWAPIFLEAKPDIVAYLGRAECLVPTASPPDGIKAASPANATQVVKILLSLPLTCATGAEPEGKPWDAADWRASYDERAAIAEYDGGLSRPDAESRAWDCCVVEWLNRHAVRSEPGWCHACGGNGVLKTLLPYGTETGGHVWLHADCWPSWHARRRDEAAGALKAMGLARGRADDVETKISPGENAET